MPQAKQNTELLRNCDLNLLIALSVLLKHAHVSRAAKQLGLSQSAMSQVLKRLRLMFEDPLLIKSHNGMMLTNKAQGLTQDLEHCLSLAMDILDGDHFDPKTAQGHIRFTMNDIAAQLCIVPMLQHISAKAPLLELEYISQHSDGFQQLTRGQVDIVVGFYDSIPRHLNYKTIASAPWQFVSQDPVFTHSHPDVEQLKQLQLIRYQFQQLNQLSQLDRLKRLKGEDSNYSLTSGSLSVLTHGLNSGSSATFLPHYAVNILPKEQIEKLNWFGPVSDLELKMCWNNRSRHYELHKWVRSEMAEILKAQVEQQSR